MSEPTPTYYDGTAARPVGSTQATSHLTARNIAVVNAAMAWAEEQWPWDPEGPGSAPTMFAGGEVLVPQRLEVHSYDGYRIGWITCEDDQFVFTPDYHEDPR